MYFYVNLTDVTTEQGIRELIEQVLVNSTILYLKRFLVEIEKIDALLKCLKSLNQFSVLYCL